jgi:predicted dinucleotide-binding enzyme
MNVAIIGTGNVSGALATKWANNGHRIYLGVRDTANFKGQDLLNNPNTIALSIQEAVLKSEVIVLASPAMMAFEVAQSLGDTTGKVIIDTMNIVMGRGPASYSNATDAILANTNTIDVVKCFNTTGFNKLANPNYGDQILDVFVAGDSSKGKEIAQQLA